MRDFIYITDRRQQYRLNLRRFFAMFQRVDLQVMMAEDLRRRRAHGNYLRALWRAQWRLQGRD